MWLRSTTEGDKRHFRLFQSPLKVALQGGSGAGASNSVINGGGNDLTQSAGQSKRGDGADKSAKKMSGDKNKVETAMRDAKRLAALSAKIAGVISNNPKLSEFNSQIRLEITPDGLQIQIVDDQRRPMFDSGSAVVKPYMREILREIGIALTDVENKISWTGTPTAQPTLRRGYSNWELSADRANATRRGLAASGMPEEKLARVVGMGSACRWSG